MLSNYIKSVLNYIPVVSLMLLIIVLPFRWGRLHQVIILLFSFSYLLDFIVCKRYKLINWNRLKWMYVPFILYFIFIPVWHIFEPTTTMHYYSALEHRLPFLIGGIIGILGLNDKFRLNYFIWVQLITSLAIIIVILFYTGINHLTEFNSDVLWLNFIRREKINSHMVVNLYWNFTLIGVIYLIRSFLIQQKTTIGNKIKITIAILGGMFIYFFLMISEGRTGFIIANIIILSSIILLFTKIKRQHILITIILTFFFLCIIVLFAINNHRFKSEIIGNEPRFQIWRVASEVISQNWFWGYGVAEARIKFVDSLLNDEVLRNNYVEKYKYFCNNILQKPIDLQKMHPHNVFIETQMELGVLGLICLLLCYVLPIWLCKYRCQRFFLTLIILAFFIQSLTETYGPHLHPLWFIIMLLLYVEVYTPLLSPAEENLVCKT